MVIVAVTRVVIVVVRILIRGSCVGFAFSLVCLFFFLPVFSFRSCVRFLFFFLFL